MKPAGEEKKEKNQNPETKDEKLLKLSLFGKYNQLVVPWPSYTLVRNK